MTFEEWKKRPVYVAQCRTWAKAAEMGLAVHPFRALPGYRNAAATMARNRVAEVIREERRHPRLH